MTTSPTDPPLDPAAPRVLLLGHAGSGKSSLLGALLRAGESQGETLRAEVIDPTHNLDLVRDHLYAGKPLTNTPTELVTHVVRLLPWRINTRPMFDPFNVVLLDCDGSAANSLFKHPDPLTNPNARGTVAAAVVQSDAILLAVDARSDQEAFETAFEDFDTFLTLIGRAKTNAREVGGFPVYLVLTRCDMLAAPGDTAEAWQAKIDAKLETAQSWFLDYMGDEDADGIPSPFMAFGQLELSVHAVAVRRPPLAGDKQPANEPFGVAELFRGCFREAKSHRERVVASNRRLKWTVRAALAMVMAMLAGLATMLVFAPWQADTGLAERVQAYERVEPPAATRLADGYITRNKRILTAFQQDAAFGGLPEEQRVFVTGRLKEIEDYQAYRAKLAATSAPINARSLDELARIEAALTTDLEWPLEYAWGDTAAARLRSKWLADVPLVRDAEGRWHDHFRDFVRRGTTLTLAPSFDGNWRSDLETAFAAASALPFDPNTPIPGSAVEDQPRGEAVTYRIPFEFDRVIRRGETGS